MHSKKILMTTIAVVLGGFTSISMADSAFVNVDYAIHADNANCLPGTTDTDGDGRADSGDWVEAGEPTKGPVTATPAVSLLTVANTGTAGGCLPALAGAEAGTVTAPTSTVPIFYFNTTGTTFANTEVANGIMDSQDEAGKPYSVEILQNGSGTLPSGEDGAGTPKVKYAGVLYTIDGWVDKDFRVTFSLNGANFDGEPLFGIANSNVDVGSTADPTGYYQFTSFSRVSSGAGKAAVSFDVSPADSDAVKQGSPDNRLNNKSLLLLLYRIQDASVLQTAGGEVTMDVKFKAFTADAVELPVNRNLSTVIATSKNSLDARMYEEDNGTIYISVNDNSKLFTDKAGSVNPNGAFRSTTVARIGYLELGPDQTTYQPDGVNPFTVGEDLGTAGEASQLVINTGQFAASVQNPGAVRLVNVATDAVITSVLSTDGQATFDLTDQQLADIYNATDGVAIEFVVDTATEINLVEEPPRATLTINFDDTTIVMDTDLADTLVDVPMRQIFQDGVVCWAFNVPYATVQDRFNIRITNESAVAGAMTVTMYEAGGNEVTSAELVNVQDANGNDVLPTLKSEADMGTGTGTVQNLLPAGQTLFLNSERLEAALGTSWTGRAVLRIVSELPEVEMLAMLRNQLMDDASQPLNNLSLGAQGISCTQGQ